MRRKGEWVGYFVTCEKNFAPPSLTHTCACTHPPLNSTLEKSRRVSGRACARRALGSSTHMVTNRVEVWPVRRACHTID